MAVYKVIQDIEAEDKLLGPLTLKQFIFAIISAGFIFVAFMIVSKTGLIYLAIPFLPFIIAFGVLAAPLSKDQPTDLWLAARIRFLLKPRKRIWDQSGIKELVTITVPKKEIKQLTKNLSQGEVKSRLEALADTLDSRGWAVKNVSLSNCQNPAFAYAYAGGEDRLIDPTSLPSAVEDTTITNADDILDPYNNPTAQHFEEMVQASTAQHKAQAVQQMQQAINQSSQSSFTNPSADDMQADGISANSKPKDFYFMHEPDNPEDPNGVVFKEQTIAPKSQQQEENSTKEELAEIEAEDKILEQLHAAKSQDSFFNPHHKTIKTPEQIEKENLARRQAEALEEQLTKQQMTPAANPVNMELAQSNDLSVDTISKLANRKKDDGVVEVDLR
jgi:hypothetical protein